MKALIRTAVLLTLVVSSAGAAPIFRNPLPVPRGVLDVNGIRRADFNGDGHDDVLLVSPAKSLNVMLSNGTGPFSPPKVTPITSYGREPGIGDVNGDGRIDVVISDFDTRQITPMLGNGDGTFTAGTSFTAPFTIPEPVAVADFNGDGFADVAVSRNNYTDNPIAVHLGNGTGQFGPGILTANSYGVLSLRTGDLNGDGRADIITGAFSDNRVFLSNGNGTFTFKIGLGGGGVLVADFNRDAKADLAVAASYSVSVAMGNGDGTLQPAKSYVASYGSRSIDAADVDDDGNLDLLAGGGNSVTLLRGNADGTFDAPEHILTGGPYTTNLVAADFDWDGEEDFLVYGSNELQSLAFVRGKGDGTFDMYEAFLTSPVPASYPGLSTRGPVVADLNGDARPDVAVVRQQPGTQLGPFELAVFLNDGTGTLAAPLLSNTESDGWTIGPVFDLGDINGDGWLDAVVISNLGYDPKGVAMLGNGNGTFRAPVEFTIGIAGTPKLGHYTSDTNLDLLLTAGSVVHVYPGNGDGTFGAGAGTSVDVWNVLHGDLNGDGRMDFIGYSTSLIRAAVNNGNGHFTVSTISLEEVTPAALADFNGDGALDLLITTYTGTQMRFGNGNGTFGSPVSFTMEPVPNYPFADPTTTADFDGDGKIDVAFGTTVYLSNGDGTFHSRAQFRTDCTGIAAVDLDASGSPDLVIVNRDADEVGVLLTRTTADPVRDSSITLTSDKGTAGYAEGVTFEATVTGGTVALSGAVVFSEGDREVAIIAVDLEGKASFATAFAIGSHTMTARYVGDEYYRESSASLGITVTKAKPPLTVSAYPNPSQFGFEVTINPYLGYPRRTGFAAPTGSITVREGGTPIGSPVPVGSGGNAKTKTLTVGTHTISADYPGDANYEAATGSYTQTVIKPIPSLWLTTVPGENGRIAGSPITLRANLGPAVITGTVTFYGNGTLLGSATVSNRIAEVQATFPWGWHTIKLVYSGDDSYGPAENTSQLHVLAGPWGTPVQLIATGSGSPYGSVYLTWSWIQGATTYKLWQRASLAEGWTLVQTYSGVIATTLSMPPNTTRLFAVSAVDANGVESALGPPDIATSVSFTDGTLTPRVTRVRAAHLIELRAAIGYARTYAGLPAFAYTRTIAAGQRIRSTDLTETRTALAQVRSALGLSAISFTDATPSVIRAVHVTELRSGVR